jgi:ABC-2 type transport system ATP-binding protein
MTTPLLWAQGLHKAYGDKPALTNVSLQLRGGTMTALLGPNGAGKSTLLQLLTGLFNPDQGQVSINGHAMHTHPAQALAGLGVVFQQSALDLDLSVRSNLLYHCDLHGMPRSAAHQQMGHWLHAMGLTDHARTVTRQLSGGNRRKIELVRALLHRPRVLLMDEATVGLDPSSRHQLLAAVRGLCQSQGMAVLWATHLIEETVQADRLLLLHHGTVRFDGNVTEFMAQAERSTTYEAEMLRQLASKV